MSLSLILFQQKVLQLISQYLVTFKEQLLLFTAGYHHYLHFCLIWIGLYKFLNEIILKEKKNQFCFRYQMCINIFVSYMLLRLKPTPQRICVKLCKDQSIDVLTTYISQSFTGFRESFSINIWWNLTSLFKNLIPRTYLWQALRKKWLTYLLMNVMLRYSVNNSWNSRTLFAS